MGSFFDWAQGLRKRVATSSFRQKRREVSNSKFVARQSSLAALLPTEVLLLVFSHIPVSETWRNSPLYGITGAASAALTCRSWVYAAMTVLYTHILLIGFHSAALFYRTIQSNPQLGLRVKTVDMPVLYEPWKQSRLEARKQKRWLKDVHWPGHSAALSALLDLCPNVIELSFALKVYEVWTAPLGLWVKSPESQSAPIEQLTHLRLLHPHATELAHIMTSEGGLEAMRALRTLELHMSANTWDEHRSHEDHCYASANDVVRARIRSANESHFDLMLGGVCLSRRHYPVYLVLLNRLSVRIDSLALLRCSFPTTIVDTILSSLQLDAPVSGFLRLKKLTLSGHSPFHPHHIPCYNGISSLLAPSNTSRNDRMLLVLPITHLSLVDQILPSETFELFSSTLESIFWKLTVYPENEPTSSYRPLLCPLLHTTLARTLRTLMLNWRLPINDSALSTWNCVLPGLLGLETLVLGLVPTYLLACDPAFPTSTSGTESGFIPPPPLSLPPNIQSLRLDCFVFNEPLTIPAGKLEIIKLLFASVGGTSSLASQASRYPNLKDVEIHAPGELTEKKHAFWKSDIITLSARDACQKNGITIRAISDY